MRTTPPLCFLARGPNLFPPPSFPPPPRPKIPPRPRPVGHGAQAARQPGQTAQSRAPSPLPFSFSLTDGPHSSQPLTRWPHLSATFLLHLPLSFFPALEREPDSTPVMANPGFLGISTFRAYPSLIKLPNQPRDTPFASKPTNPCPSFVFREDWISPRVFSASARGRTSLGFLIPGWTPR